MPLFQQKSANKRTKYRQNSDKIFQIFGSWKMELSEDKKIYLLPLFLKKMSEALGFTQDSLCDEALRLLAVRLEDTHRKLSEKFKTLTPRETKCDRNIEVIFNTINKVEEDTGGKQITVLYRAESILKKLEKWPHVNTEDLARLQQIIKAKHLFSSPYNTGIERKTITRLLSVKNTVASSALKVQLVKDVFLHRLEKEDTRSIFFNNYLTDRERVISAFFCYEGMYANFDSLEIVVDEILMLKEKDDLDAALKDILLHLTMISQATLLPMANRIAKEMKEKLVEEENQESSEYTVFHENAIRYISDKIFLKCAQPPPQLLYSIIDDAWLAFFNICRSKHISREDSTYQDLFRELILHSLHNQEEIHVSLCTSFGNWQRRQVYD